MDNNVTFDAVVAALRTICHNPLLCLSPDTHLDEVPGMDSLRLLHVVAMLEEEFGVEIEVGALERLHKVQDIVQAVFLARTAAPDGH